MATYSTSNIQWPTAQAFDPSAAASQVGTYTSNLLYQYPGYAAITRQLRGEVAPTTRQQLYQAGAERGIATGLQGADVTNAAMLQALGLTSEGIRQQGISNLAAATQALPQVDVQGLYVPASTAYTGSLQQASDLLREAGLQYRAELGEEGALERAQLGETGATERAGMAQAGETYRTQLGQAGQTERTQLGLTAAQSQAGASNRATSAVIQDLLGQYGGYMGAGTQPTYSALGSASQPAWNAGWEYGSTGAPFRGTQAEVGPYEPASGEAYWSDYWLSPD